MPASGQSMYGYIVTPAFKGNTCHSSGLSTERALIFTSTVLHCGRWTKRERERERERERGHRQTDRQTDKTERQDGETETDRQTDKGDRQTDRQTERERFFIFFWFCSVTLFMVKRFVLFWGVGALTPKISSVHDITGQNRLLPLVQFGSVRCSSKWYLWAQRSPYALPLVSQKFPGCVCTWQ